MEFGHAPAFENKIEPEQMETKLIVRVIPHRRRLQHEPKECLIAKPPGKKKVASELLTPSSHDIVVQKTAVQEIQWGKKGLEKNGLETNRPLANVRSNCDGNSQRVRSREDVRSNNSGAEKEDFAAASGSVFGSSGSWDIFGNPLPKPRLFVSENPIPFSIETRADDNSEGNSSRPQQLESRELEMEDSR